MVRAVVFPGQGSQVVGMAKDFYDNFKVSRDVFQEVDEALNKKLSDIIFNGPLEELTITSNAQPAIMVACMAIVRALEQELGFDISRFCSFTAGHSLGEYTALCAANCIRLDETARLLKARGDAFQKASEKNPGTMAVIGAPLEIVENIVKEAVLDGEVLEVTNDNTSEQVVISGCLGSVDNALEIAKRDSIRKVKKLAVSGAFHSKLMEPAVEIMKNVLEHVEIYEPEISVFSNYSSMVENKDEIKENLVKQIVNKVRWREIVLNMEKLDVKQYVEIGTGRILTNMIGKICPTAEAIPVNSVESMKNFIKSIH